MKRIKLSNKDKNTIDSNGNPQEANTNWKTKTLKTHSKHLSLDDTVQSDDVKNLKLEMPLETMSNKKKSTRVKQFLPEILPEEPREKISQQMPKLKLKNLTKFKKGSMTEDFAMTSKDLDSSPIKKKLRATVNIKMMKEELKQLEDPPTTPREIELSSARLRYEFFDSPCKTLAQNLLGKILVRQLENGTILKGRIVETESYLGAIDKASQTYQNRITSRNIPMYMPPGTIYVYLTYGMYHCFNISSQGDGCAVLVRSIEPLEGMDHMTNVRNLKPTSKEPRTLIKYFKPHELCNGPSKLCIAFNLERTHSKYSMCTWKSLWLEDDVVEQEIKIVQCARIGIDSAGPEWANKPLRYYVYGNKSVSKRNKKAETELLQSD